MQNAPEKLQQVFAGHRVYMGGWVSQNVVFCMHGHPLPKAVQVGITGQPRQVSKNGGGPSPDMCVEQPLTWWLHLLQIVPGLYLGGEAAAAEEVEAGRIQADDFK
jgi:hypothetical protein